MAKWTIDPSHSEIGFKVKHLMITNVKGFFKAYSGEVETAGDDLNNASIKFSAQTASVDTASEQRDAHLRSADFFDADNHPSMDFVSTSVTKKSGDEYALKGNLTIRGVTKPVEFNVEFNGIAKDPWGNTKSGATLSGTINRKDFGLNWNAALEAGGVLVSEEVKIHADVQLLQQA
jgi:polyisoprenoid-binding protein YceI